MATLEGNKRKSEEMNPKTVLRVVWTTVGHFIEAVGDDFAGFGYWKVSKNKSLKEEIFSEKKKAILKKKREWTQTTPDSKEHTTPESSQKSSPMHVSSMVSPRRSPRFSISTPVQITYDSPPPKIQKEVISAGPPSEEIFSEKKKAILKKKKERTQITPDSKEHTTPESSQKSDPMHVSSIVSPRSPRFSISSPVQSVYDSPSPKIQKEVISAGPPIEKVPSIVIPVKNASRKKKVPAKFDGFSSTLKWPPNSDYKLTDEETKLLDQFWDDYCKRADKLSIYCTSPTSKKLKKLLSREWMETGLLQNWFDVYLKPKAPHAYFIDATASDIWLKQSKERYVHIFGEFGWRVDIMKKHEVIVIPMCYLEHFTVIMGYPKEGKWEYYNSMPMDKRQWPKAEEFIIWLNDSFADFGWEGPRGWIRRNVDDVPIQENLYDCGFFVMGFVEHAILNCKIAFNQQDMMYYRCKLVVHLYRRQWELYQRRLQESKGASHIFTCD